MLLCSQLLNYYFPLCYGLGAFDDMEWRVSLSLYPPYARLEALSTTIRRLNSESKNESNGIGLWMHDHVCRGCKCRKICPNNLLCKKQLHWQVRIRNDWRQCQYLRWTMPRKKIGTNECQWLETNSNIWRCTKQLWDDFREENQVISAKTKGAVR